MRLRDLGNRRDNPTRKDVNQLVKKLRSQGWRVENTKAGHMAYSPHGYSKVLFHKTPSDHRTMRNTIARLVQGGYDPNA